MKKYFQWSLTGQRFILLMESHESTELERRRKVWWVVGSHFVGGGNRKYCGVQRPKSLLGLFVQRPKRGEWRVGCVRLDRNFGSTPFTDTDRHQRRKVLNPSLLLSVDEDEGDRQRDKGLREGKGLESRGVRLVQILEDDPPVVDTQEGRQRGSVVSPKSDKRFSGVDSVGFPHLIQNVVGPASDRFDLMVRPPVEEWY